VKLAAAARGSDRGDAGCGDVIDIVRALVRQEPRSLLEF
jgi:hypothetical protein